MLEDAGGVGDAGLVDGLLLHTEDGGHGGMGMLGTIEEAEEGWV